MSNLEEGLPVEVKAEVRKIVYAFRYDLVFIALASLGLFFATFYWHGDIKLYTSAVATLAPLVFAASVLLMLTIVGINPHATIAKKALRGLVFIALASLVLPSVFLKSEYILAPIEYVKKTSTSEVLAKIATDDNFERAKAWSRIITLPKEGKDEVALGLVPMLLGADEKAKHSADVTLKVVLRKHTLTALTGFIPYLKSGLSKQAAGLALNADEALALAFGEHFVQNNIGSILKALSPKKRDLLPKNGLEALFLALATEKTVGPGYLTELSLKGDAQEKPTAQAVVKLAGIKG